MRKADYHHPVPLSRNLGTLTSRNTLGPSRPVTGLLYLYCNKEGECICFHITKFRCQFESVGNFCDLASAVCGPNEN